MRGVSRRAKEGGSLSGARPAGRKTAVPGERRPVVVAGTGANLDSSRGGRVGTTAGESNWAAEAMGGGAAGAGSAAKSAAGRRAKKAATPRAERCMESGR
jgi:hypothetical protein